jgi:hypothetical protein
MSLEISVQVGSVYFYVRQYDEAIAACKMLVSENPRDEKVGVAVGSGMGVFLGG